MTAGTGKDWRLILGRGDGTTAPDPARGAINMAVDAALLDSVQRRGRPVLRLYTWQPACLSLGRNQRASGIYDPGRAVAAGIDIVRRPTGGLAVLHDHELTYCILAPLTLLGGPRAAYERINRALVEALRALGVAAGQAEGTRSRGPTHGASDPCFQAPAPGEVVALERKLVGSAQRCERGALLQHGSILLGGSQGRVRDLLTDPGDAPAVPDGSVALGELLPAAPAAAAVATAVCHGFERVFGTRLAPDALTAAEHDSMGKLIAHFDSPDWTWRR